MPRHLVERTFAEGLHIPTEATGTKACIHHDASSRHRLGPTMTPSGKGESLFLAKIDAMARACENHEYGLFVITRAGLRSVPWSLQQLRSRRWCAQEGSESSSGLYHQSASTHGTSGRKHQSGIVDIGPSTCTPALGVGVS